MIRYVHPVLWMTSFCSQAKVARRRRAAEARRTRSLGLGYKVCAVIPDAGRRTHRTTFRALKVASQMATQGRSLRYDCYDCLVFITAVSSAILLCGLSVCPLVTRRCYVKTTGVKLRGIREILGLVSSSCSTPNL